MRNFGKVSLDTAETASDEFAFSVRMATWNGTDPSMHSFEVAFVTRRDSQNHIDWPWSLVRLVVAASSEYTYDKIAEYKWDELDEILVDAKRLEGLHVLCDPVVKPEEVTQLHELLKTRMHRSPLRLRRASEGHASITLEPLLFVREPMSLELDYVFHVNPSAFRLEIPKYVRI